MLQCSMRGAYKSWLLYIRARGLSYLVKIRLLTKEEWVVPSIYILCVLYVPQWNGNYYTARQTFNELIFWALYTWYTVQKLLWFYYVITWNFFGSLLKLYKHIYFIDVYELICKSCTLKGLGHETEFTYLDKNNYSYRSQFESLLFWNF